MWEGDVRTPIQWSPEAPRIFADCGLQFPYPTDAETSTASVSVSNAEAPATLADVETAEQEQVVLAKPNHHSSPSSSLSRTLAQCAPDLLCRFEPPMPLFRFFFPYQMERLLLFCYSFSENIWA